MDVLDELNAEIERLVAIAERERERTLAELIRAARLGVEYGPDPDAQVAQLALDYAEWHRAAKSYRDQLRPRGELRRVK